jgi:HEAT repeat protein
MNTPKVRQHLLKISIFVLALVFANRLPAKQSASASKQPASSQEDVVASLIQKLKDGNRQVRYDAASELGEAKDPRAVEPLTAMLKDRDRQVRRAAKNALERLKEPGAKP